MPRNEGAVRTVHGTAAAAQVATTPPRPKPDDAGTVTLFDHRYPIKTWGEQYVVIGSCDADCKPDDILPIRLTVSLGGSMLDIACQGYVIRANRARGEVALMLSGLSRIARAAIAKHFSA